MDYTITTTLNGLYAVTDRSGRECLFKGTFEECREWCCRQLGIQGRSELRKGDIVNTPPEAKRGLTEGVVIGDPFSSGWREQVYVGFFGLGWGAWVEVFWADEVSVVK